MRAAETAVETQRWSKMYSIFHWCGNKVTWTVEKSWNKKACHSIEVASCYMKHDLLQYESFV